MALAPGIHQRIGRAGIEATYRTFARNQGQVGDTAQIEHGAVFVGRAQHGQVEGRHQWRTMAPGRHVAAAEVGDRGDPGQLGDAVAVAQLHGEGGVGQRPVTHGLPMRADRTHLAAVHASLGQQLVGGPGEADRDPGVQLAQLLQRIQWTTFAQRHQPCTQHRLPAGGQAVHEAAASAARKLHQRGIDAVGTGARHQAKVQGGRQCRQSCSWRA
ncbi:hypothetical protein SM139_2995 [Stenotrophomonas maltophilia]|nr:hypothetical protein SM139_2995 [Stenotrophomonas maltophilia]